MSTALTTHTAPGTQLDTLGPSPDQLVRAWLAEYAAPNTRAAYERDLAGWLAFCAAPPAPEGFEADEADEDRPKPVHPLEARRVHVSRYRECLEDGTLTRTGEPATPATIARKLAAISSFYAYWVAEGALMANPAAHAKRPRVGDESASLGLDRDELRGLLNVARQAGRRDYALTGLLALLGLRVSSACSITAEDVTTERGHRVVTVSTKGGKVLRRTLPAELAAAVDALALEHPTGPLLGTNAPARTSTGEARTDKAGQPIGGKPLSRYDAARIIRRLANEAARAGILSPDKARRLTPHSLRHTCATNALDAGAPLHVVADSLGHSSARTTQRYDRARRSLERDPAYLLAAYVAE